MDNMDNLILYYSLALCSLTFVVCFAVNLGLAIDCYKKNPNSFFKTLIDYSKIVQYMGSKERKLFYATFLGALVSLPAFGYSFLLMMQFCLNK